MSEENLSTEHADSASVTNDNELRSFEGETSSYSAFKNLLLTMNEETERDEQFKGIPSAKNISASILEEIIKGAENQINAKGVYEQKCQAHNQYNLFHLIDHIKKFNIDDDMYEAITFRETLIVNKLELRNIDCKTVFEPVPVGGICVDIQKAEGKQPQARLLEEYEEKLLRLLDEEGICNHIGSDEKMPDETPIEDSLEEQNQYGYSKFLVHLSSHLDVDGENGGSSITSWVDRNCHTIEELRKEFIATEENVNEKSLYMAMKRNWYFVKHTASLNYIDDKKLYSMRKACDYISEGASFILMRYLAITRFLGSFELSCCYINGDMCRNIYDCFGPESAMIETQKVDCCKIQRTIIEECGIKHISLTVLALNGLILKHEWDDCDYVLTCNPQMRITNEKPTCLDELTSDNWNEDIQLLSMYLDMKTTSLLENKTYDYDHPELRQLLADFVNQILLLRPPDIKDFTYKYFGNFITTPMPRNDYLE